VNMSFILP